MVDMGAGVCFPAVTAEVSGSERIDNDQDDVQTIPPKGGLYYGTEK
jgi:hypothetical protein